MSVTRAPPGRGLRAPDGLWSHARVIKPEGPGPFPVMVQLHGCGGVQPFQSAYAEVARTEGVAAVVVDSLGPRGISRLRAKTTVCTGLALRARERAFDLAAVVARLHEEPWADPARIGAAGWSHGAWTLMEALVAPEECGLAGELKTAVLIYPYAGPLSRTALKGWGGRRPEVYVCLAGRDAVVGRRGPRAAVDRLRGEGLSVTLLDLPDATHAFDDEFASDPRSRFCETSRSRAQELYADAARALRRGPA